MGDGQVTESFVTRIWLERAANGDPVWRGHIQHVQSGQERYFHRLEEMRDFMESLTGIPCGTSRTNKIGDAGTT